MTRPADRAVRAARSIEKTGQAQAHELRAAEIVAWTEVLGSLGPDDWSRPSVCALWDVKDIVGHLCGHAEEDLRPWLFPLRDRRAARPSPRDVLHRRPHAGPGRRTPRDDPRPTAR